MKGYGGVCYPKRKRGVHCVYYFANRTLQNLIVKLPLPNNLVPAIVHKYLFRFGKKKFNKKCCKGVKELFKYLLMFTI